MEGGQKPDKVITDAMHETLHSHETQDSKYPGHLAYVAIVSPSNAPLFIRRYENGKQGTSGSSSNTKQMFEVIYNALDVITERSQGDKETGMESESGFVGCLAVFGIESLYGSITNGGYKVLISVRGGGDRVDSVGGALRTAFHRIEDALIAAQLNPMQKMDAPLHGRMFQKSIKDVVSWYG